MLIIISAFPIELSSAEPIGSKTQLIKFKSGEDVQFADVRPNHQSTVNFHGLIDGRQFSGNTNVTKIICTLEARIEQRWYHEGSMYEQGWFVEIYPEDVELVPGEQKEFDVTVFVPPETSYYSKGELKVFGTAKTLPDNEIYTINEIKGKIRIQYYYAWTMASSDITTKVSKGDTAVIKVNVVNLGNGDDVFYQDMNGKDKLIKSKMNVDFPNNIEIKEKSNEEVKIKIKTTSDTPAGEYQFEFLSYPTDVKDKADSQDPNYLIKFKLIVEPDFVEEYFVLSIVAIAIILIVIVVKVVRMKKK
jgi:uncharacterized membrane protein